MEGQRVCLAFKLPIGDTFAAMFDCNRVRLRRCLVIERVVYTTERRDLTITYTEAGEEEGVVGGEAAESCRAEARGLHTAQAKK